MHRKIKAGQITVKRKKGIKKKTYVKSVKLAQSFLVPPPTLGIGLSIMGKIGGREGLIWGKGRGQFLSLRVAYIPNLRLLQSLKPLKSEIKFKSPPPT